MNCCFQRKERQFEILAIKDSIKLINSLKKNYQGYLKFIVNSIGVETDFRELKDPEAFLGSIKKPEISLEETRYKQKQFRRYLKRIKTGNKSDEQKKTLANIKKFFDGRNDAIKFVGDYNDS